MDNIEIALSKGSIILNILVLLLFITVGADVFLNGHHYETYIFYNKFIINYIFPIPYLLMILGIFPLLSKLFSSKKGLIITENGIIMNLAYVDFGLIKWKDIAKIDEKEIMSKKIITINVVDSDVYLKRVKNPIFLFFLRRRINKYHYLITISSQLLSINNEELLKLLQGSFKKFKYNA